MQQNTQESTPKKQEPTTQERPNFRSRWPVWMQQLPRVGFPTSPNLSYQLIDLAELQKLIERENPDPEAVKRLQADIEFLDHELLRLFRERDYDAKYSQNQYRLYQILFMSLAASATLVGALQALLLSSNQDAVPMFSLIETVIALFTTYLATISGREAPLPVWLSNRQKAESLRREYFRYLLNLPPYDVVSGYERRQLLSSRAANFNRGMFPVAKEND